MLELFGSGYVIEHCISTFKYNKKEYLYKIYVSDLLRGLYRNPNVINRYYDIIESLDKPSKEPDPEEIKDRIKNGINKLRGE